jgi:lipopolysaccharide biosynthesis glycosyltransferase
MELFDRNLRGLFELPDKENFFSGVFDFITVSESALERDCTEGSLSLMKEEAKKEEIEEKLFDFLNALSFIYFWIV